MLHRKNRIRRAFTLFMLWSTTFAAVGLVYLHFKSKGRKWQRIVLTDSNGGPWSWTSGIIDPFESNEQLKVLRKSGIASEGWSGDLANSVFSVKRFVHEPWTSNPTNFSYGIGPFSYSSRAREVFTPLVCRMSPQFVPEQFPWHAPPPFDPAAPTKRLLARQYEAKFPVWPTALALAIWPLSWLCLGPLRALLRRRKGLCLHCTYDLTGNTSGTCPECGSAIKPPKT